MKYCCEAMKCHLIDAKDLKKNNNQDKIISYNSKREDYGILGGNNQFVITIAFCPWCAEKLIQPEYNKEQFEKIIIENYSRKSYRMIMQSEIVKSTERVESLYADVSLCLPNEAWPVNSEGVPLLPLFQINLSNLPAIPKSLSKVKVLTAFIDFDPDEDSIDFFLPEDNQLVVREYSNIEELIEIKKPKLPVEISSLAMSFEPIKRDCPHPSMLDEESEFGDLDDLYTEIFDIDLDSDEGNNEYETNFVAPECSKIGGWPTICQYEPFIYEDEDDVEFLIQLASEENGPYTWGDAGILYLAKLSENEGDSKWTYDAQDG